LTGITERVSVDGAGNQSDGKSLWPPDFNDNRTVNILDVLPFKQHFGATDPTDPLYDRRFDLTPDGRINLLDLLKIKPYFGTSCT